MALLRVYVMFQGWLFSIALHQALYNNISVINICAALVYIFYTLLMNFATYLAHNWQFFPIFQGSLVHF